MKENDKMGNDVDLVELSKMTKNFSGAEIEGLVRAAQSCALNRDAIKTKITELSLTLLRIVL